MTDSVTTEFNGQPISPDIPREILLRLQSKLASCRGGNKILMPLLHARISEALIRHSPRIYEIPDHGLSSNSLPGGTIVYSSQQPQIFPLPNSPLLRSAEGYEEQTNTDGHGFSQNTTDIVPTLRVVTWGQNIPDAMLSSNQDPFNQTQVFQASFDNIESTGTMELLFANSAMWDSVESWDSQFTGAAVG